MNWDLQTPEGDWTEPGGWGHLMWAGAGYKAWSLMEHFAHTRDTAFLKRRYPQLLANSRWQHEQRKKTKILQPDGTRPLLIAVTQLTSTSPQTLKEELLINESMQDTVLHYARNAENSGLDGVVCSPLEAESVHAACGSGFITVTPGVRFANAEKDDQTRVMTPLQARAQGSDYIVVGRPVTAAADPAAAYARCVREFVLGQE